MLLFLFRHYKATVAIMGAVLTIIIVPMAMSTWGFILSTSRTNASVPKIEERVVQLENTSYRIDERFRFIQDALKLIQEREYQELKRARQLSQSGK